MCEPLPERTQWLEPEPDGAPVCALCEYDADELHEIDGEFYCEDCAPQCIRCGEHFVPSLDFALQDTDGKPVCPLCMFTIAVDAFSEKGHEKRFARLILEEGIGLTIEKIIDERSKANA